MAQTRGKLLTTPFALGEAMHLLGRELGWRGHRALWSLIGSGALEVAPQGASERMRELMEQYRDRPMDLADASLVVLAEELDGPPIVSFDDDFRIYRLRSGALMSVLPSL
jgi:predicted nucleic acid-binding protein